MMKNLHILLVEDNEGDVVLIREALAFSSTFISLEVAENGFSALEKLRSQVHTDSKLLPDAIVLDINLPGMNGKELLQTLKSDVNFEKIPVIIFSTTSSPTEIREVFNLKASWYASKPDKLKDYQNLIQDIELKIRNNVKCSSIETFIIS